MLSLDRKRRASRIDGSTESLAKRTKIKEIEAAEMVEKEPPAMGLRQRKLELVVIGPPVSYRYGEKRQRQLVEIYSHFFMFGNLEQLFKLFYENKEMFMN